MAGSSTAPYSGLYSGYYDLMITNDIKICFIYEHLTEPYYLEVATVSSAHVYSSNVDSRIWRVKHWMEPERTQDSAVTDAPSSGLHWVW